MPKKVTVKRLQEFSDLLSSFGGHAGNKRMRDHLGWDEEFYWKVQGKLIEQGEIIAGRGKGGSVNSIHDADSSTTDGPNFSDKDDSFDFAETERELYAPLTKSIASWVRRFGLDHVFIIETHSQGSKKTGGTYTRPDLTVVGLRSYIFLPKQLEVMTFEVKTNNSISIIGVLEALAHRESSNRCFAVFNTSAEKFRDHVESERIIDLAQKYGVGVLLIENPNSIESWEVLVEAQSHQPDPSRLDTFLTDLHDEEVKNKILKWNS